MSEPLLAFIGLTLAGYVMSLYLHPYTKCRTCNGRGTHYGQFWSYASRNCHSCSGKGRRQRWGAVVLRIGEPTHSSSRIQPPTRTFGGRRR